MRITILGLIVVNIAVIFLGLTYYKNSLDITDKTKFLIVAAQDKNIHLQHTQQNLKKQNLSSDIDLLKGRYKVSLIANSLNDITISPVKSTSTGEKHYAKGNIVDVLLFTFIINDDQTLQAIPHMLGINDNEGAIEYEIFGEYK